MGLLPLLPGVPHLLPYADGLHYGDPCLCCLMLACVCKNIALVLNLDVFLLFAFIILFGFLRGWQVKWQYDVTQTAWTISDLLFHSY